MKKVGLGNLKTYKVHCVIFITKKKKKKVKKGGVGGKGNAPHLNRLRYVFVAFFFVFTINAFFLPFGANF